jgi:hypothetical protein
VAGRGEQRALFFGEDHGEKNERLEALEVLEVRKVRRKGPEGRALPPKDLLYPPWEEEIGRV